jgi:hypothetical protein
MDDTVEFGLASKCSLSTFCQQNFSVNAFVNGGDPMEPSTMPMKRRLELLAAALVAQFLGGESEGRDRSGPGAEDGVHDFDVTLATGRIIALEVTTAANQRMIETTAAFRKMRDASFPSLTHHWGLTGRHPSEGERGPQINALAKQGDALLHRLEIAGVHSSTRSIPAQSLPSWTSSPWLPSERSLSSARSLADK